MVAATNGHLEVARLLLDRSADPNQACTDDGWTALMVAATNGHLEVTQVLLVFGAEPTAVAFGRTAHGFALIKGHQPVVDCLEAIAGWPAFKVAVAARRHADARAMLHRGAIDPSGSTLAELTVLGALPADALWPGSPAPCAATTALVNAAMASWSPIRHSLYHPGVRTSVRTVLLAAEHLRRRHAAAAAAMPPGQARLMPWTSLLCLPVLPDELWHIVCSFFLRSDWSVR